MSVRFIRGAETINSGVCLRDLNLLAHAQMIELEVGSSCGGYGKCAGDRVVLSEKDQKLVNPPTEVERLHFQLRNWAEDCVWLANVFRIRMVQKLPRFYRRLSEVRTRDIFLAIATTRRQ